MKFSKNQIDFSKINGGNRFKSGDSVTPEAINAPIEASAFAQAIATNQPDVSEIAGVGEPNVSIVGVEEGNPRLKFSNLLVNADQIVGEIDKLREDFDEQVEIQEQKDLAQDTQIRTLREDFEWQVESQYNTDAMQDDAIYANSGRIDTISRSLELASRQLELMRMQLYGTIIATIEDSYKSRITADGLTIYDNQNTFVKRIEGASMASANILPPPENWYNSTTIGGVTFTVDKDKGEITINGTATERAVFVYSPHIPVSVGSYVIGAKEKGDFLSMGDANKDGAWYKSIVSSITLEEEGAYMIVPYIQIQEGKTLNNVVVHPYLQIGTTALPWNKPFKGLQTAKIDRIVSTGHNYIPYPYVSKFPVTKEGITFTDLGDGRIRAVGTSTAYANVDLSASLPLQDGVTYYNKSTGLEAVNVVLSYFDETGTKKYFGHGASRVWSKNYSISGCYVQILPNHTIDTIIYPMISTISTTAPFEPYTESIYQLPETVEVGEYDYIDVEQGKIYHYTQAIDPATATITQETVAGDGSMGFIVWLPVDPYLEQSNSGYNYGFGISSDFNYLGEAEEIYFDNSFSIVNGSMIFRSDADADVEAFRARLSGGKTIYRTANPIAEQSISIPDHYTAWNGGTETIIADGDAMNENAHPIIVQEYVVKG